MKENREKAKKPLWREILEWVLTIAAALAIAFYDYVNGKDDGFLAKADFPREEIMEGLRDALKVLHMELPEYLRI